MSSLQKRLSGAIGKNLVHTDDLTLISTAADAGCYRKIPKIVLNPQTEKQLIESLRILNETGTPVTFRAAGTSLSGQAISDSVLLQARGDHWSHYEILEEGRLIKAEPGITGTRLNQLLAHSGMKFGPDPASISSAMVGGIIANNASGMSCGIHANSYATIRSARIIFPDGTLLDTASRESCESFLGSRPELVSVIMKIRDEILSRPELVNKIRKKYSIKNTTGYGMNAFLDYEDPIEIILHLMVGSEGTLGFVSEATFATLPLKPFRASSLIYFKDLEAACNAVPLLREARVPAIEIMDRKALRSVENNKGIPEYLKSLGREVTALLIDLEEESPEALDTLIERTRKALSGFELVRDFEVTTDLKQITDYWNVRKGVFPSVGGMRKPGTSVIIEDVAVSAEHLTDAVMEMRRMLDRLGYEEAVIYGHVLDGNLHFIFSQDFHRPEELKQYEEMILQLTRLVVDKYDGSLKAEHGTGLNMAPFVSYEWGEELYSFMKEIKQTFDPGGILNPDVIISGDPELHLKNFKPMPVIDEAVDQCIECGFCEINCLTTGLTLSARQRIVVQREIERLSRLGKSPEKVRSLGKAFAYQGEGSCAGDGLCAVTCPLSIDTGVLIKHLRARNNERKRPGNPIATRIGEHFPAIHFFVRSGLGFMTALYRLIPFKKIWIWDHHMPRPVRKSALKAPEYSGEKGKKKVVYFPSCINQSMGTAVREKQKKSLVKVTVEVLEKAGFEVICPEHMNRLCCGTPWESKGFFDIADAKSGELEKALLKASQDGAYPVLCDTSPCTHRMKRVMTNKLDLYEPVEFIHDHLLDKLDLKKTKEALAFHVSCTSTRMGLEEKFRAVARACTENPVFPEEVGCCGFAGNKGFTRPEINTWALRNLKLQVDRLAAGYSNSRTCEIGLSRNSGIDYRSVMYLVRDSIKE
ncbi:MAG: FAD-binding and (Fe-S)-binding domain-containing protein [Bacteroidales bacterium]|nr:FAD-binding and (Fe-S)-binding domain-containing protein [Bacteroidales bacterium]